MLDDAHAAFKMRYPASITFSRAIFLNWYCPLDCKFCFMSVEKSNISSPKAARRTPASILTEAFLCSKLGWDIEFLSSGYRVLENEYLLRLLKSLYEVTGKKQWLNTGALSKQELEFFKPYIEGSCGAVETVNPIIHDKVCRNKPVAPIINMFKACDELGLRKAMTLIIGMGETIADFPKLQEFIERHAIDRITVYALNPIKGTMFTKSPEADYYIEWLARTRISFPRMEIIAGIRNERLDTIRQLAYLGVNAITKFIALRQFNSKDARFIEEEIAGAGRILQGSLTKLPDIELEEIDAFMLEPERKEQMKRTLTSYLEMMHRNTVLSKTI